MAASCPICCDSYNKSSRAAVKCCFGDCNFEACKGCVRRYLLSSTNDPHCMNCKKLWNQDFMTMNLNRSFVSKEYKETRMNLLLEKEMSKMPQTMDAAQRAKQIEVKRHEMNVIEEQITQLKGQINMLYEQKQGIREAMFNLRTTGEDKPNEKKKFIMPCSNNDCRGFLSSQYKCEMCNMHTCPKCLVLIGPDKNVEHVCNEDMVKSAEVIKQETKPCPSCGTRISKISGCNQMWCTNCHVAFHWNTGAIDNGPVHNPHFYEYQKNADANGVAPRNPGDIVCGGMCHYVELRRVFTNNITKTKYFMSQDTDKIPINNLLKLLFSLHRLGIHISEVSLPEYRRQARDIDHNEDLRVNYILKKKTKEELRTTIYQRDYTRQKNKEILYILELVNVTLIEMFAQITNSTNSKSPEKYISELEESHENFKRLAKYANEQLEIISISYNRTVPMLSCIDVNKNGTYQWFFEERKCGSYSRKKKEYSENKSKQAEEIV